MFLIHTFLKKKSGWIIKKRNVFLPDLIYFCAVHPCHIAQPKGDIPSFSSLQLSVLLPIHQSAHWIINEGKLHCWSHFCVVINSGQSLSPQQVVYMNVSTVQCNEPYLDSLNLQVNYKFKVKPIWLVALVKQCLYFFFIYFFFYPGVQWISCS